MRYVHIQLNTSSLKVDRISVSAPKVYTGALSAYIRFRPKAPVPFSVNFRFRRLRSADTKRPHYQILPSHHLTVDAAAVQMCQIIPPHSSLTTPEFQVTYLHGSNWLATACICDSGYVRLHSCWPKSAAVDRQCCASYAAVVPDSRLSSASSCKQILSADLW